MNNDEIMEKEGIANQYKLKVRRALDEARIDERNKKYSLQDSIDYAKEIDKRVADEHNKAFKEGYDKGKREGQDKTGKSDTMTTPTAPDEAHIREYLKKYFNVKAIEQLLGSKTTSHADWRESAICMLIQKEREQEYQRGYEAGQTHGVFLLENSIGQRLEDMPVFRKRFAEERTRIRAVLEKLKSNYSDDEPSESDIMSGIDAALKAIG